MVFIGKEDFVVLKLRIKIYGTKYTGKSLDLAFKLCYWGPMDYPSQSTKYKQVAEFQL